MDRDERFEALERRLAEAEEEIRILRARVAELEGSRRPLSSEQIKALLEENNKSFREGVLDVVQRIALVIVELDAVKAHQAETDRRQAEQERAMNLFVEGRGAALSTEFLLDFYEQQIAKTGKSLRSWLIDINASTRYEAVKALRSRRKAGSSN